MKRRGSGVNFTSTVLISVKCQMVTFKESETNQVNAVNLAAPPGSEVWFLTMARVTAVACVVELQVKYSLRRAKHWSRRHPQLTEAGIRIMPITCLL